MSIQLQGHGNSMLGECVSPAAIMPLGDMPRTAGRMRRTEGAQPAGGRLIVAHLPPAGGVRGLFVGYLPAICRSVRAARGRRCTRCGRSAAALPSGADGCRSARSAPFCAAAGLGGRRAAGKPGARRAAAMRAAMRATHSTAMMMTIQNNSLPTFNPDAESFPARTGCRCRPGSGNRSRSASSAAPPGRASPRRGGPAAARRRSPRTAA